MSDKKHVNIYTTAAYSSGYEKGKQDAYEECAVIAEEWEDTSISCEEGNGYRIAEDIREQSKKKGVSLEDNTEKGK